MLFSVQRGGGRCEEETIAVVKLARSTAQGITNKGVELLDNFGKVTYAVVGSLTFGELSDFDTSHAVPKQIHTQAFTGSRWDTFPDPVQQTG